MKLQEMFDLAIEIGKIADPRGIEVVEKDLKKINDEYEKLSDSKKEIFDTNKLTNPYADSRLLYGEGDREIRGVICGIDMETQELVLADRLREKGEPIDLVFAHHPEGLGLANLADMLNIQKGIMAKNGVLYNVAEGALNERIGQVSRSVSPSNHQRGVMSAKLLDMPYMCLHTPADNAVTDFVEKYLATKEIENLGDIIDALLEIPEYKECAKLGAGPHIVAGNSTSFAGKMYIDFTGGTSGSPEAYRRLAEAGISTIIAMHCPEKHIEEAKKHHLNIVIAGHIASDSLGCNLILDAFENNGVKVYATSGLIRVRR